MNAYMRSKAIAILLNYSLISRTPETRTLSIHRLIQAVLIDTMSDQERQIWIQYAQDVQTSIRTCPCPLDGGYGVLLVDVGESYPETNQEGHLCYYCVHHKHTFTLDV